MGQIDKALAKVRAGHQVKRTVKSDKVDHPLALTGNFDNSIETVDFDKLPKVAADEDALSENRIVAAQADAPARSVYKVLRTRVLQRLRSSKWNVIGVTGSGPNEGKTITAINLAYSLARDVNHRVVLVDLDLRRPSLHNYLGIAPRKDLNNYLNGSATLGEILVRPNEDRLAILTNQSSHADSSELLSSPELAKMIHTLRNLGPKTITIVDLPPVLAGDDVLAFSPLIDAILLVVAQGQCRRESLVEAQELLKDFEILGAILNRSREKTAGSGYYGYY